MQPLFLAFFFFFLTPLQPCHLDGLQQVQMDLPTFPTAALPFFPAKGRGEATEGCLSWTALADTRPAPGTRSSGKLRQEAVPHMSDHLGRRYSLGVPWL